MVAEAEARLRQMGCPKINIQIRTGNTEVIEFYRRIGFKPDDVVSMGKRLETDALPGCPTDRARTHVINR
jgi:RimJ/RimL family protein N-acetyltransferase